MPHLQFVSKPARTRTLAAPHCRLVVFGKWFEAISPENSERFKTRS